MPVSTHSRIAYKNWFTEGRKSVSIKMEVRQGHPSEVRHSLWGTKSHTTTRLLICSTGIQKTALMVFLSEYGSSLQGNHWPVIKEEEQKKIPLSKARGWVGCCVCQVVTIYNILSSILSKRQSNISVEKACLAWMRHQPGIDKAASLAGSPVRNSIWHRGCTSKPLWSSNLLARVIRMKAISFPSRNATVNTKLFLQPSVSHSKARIKVLPYAFTSYSF